MSCPRGLLCRSVAFFFCAALSLVGACEEPTISLPVPEGGDGGLPTIAGLKEIQVMPPSLTLTLSGPTQKQVFAATGLFEDGHMEDITRRVTWRVSPQSLGHMQDISTFETDVYGGEGQIIAQSGSLFGSARLSIRVSRRIVEMDAPGADESMFVGKPESAGATIAYPYDQVLMPPNLGALEVHFTRGTPSHNVFEISLQNRVTDLRIYTGCKVVGTGCVYALTRAHWDLMAYTNAGGEDPVLITVRGTDGKTVGTSKAVRMSFSPEPIRGGIYYWTAEEGGQAAIHRIDLEGGKAEPFYTTAQSPLDHQNQRVCVGCHALSHDGNTLSLVLGGAHVSDLVQLNVKDRTANLTKIDRTAGRPNVQRQYSNFQSYGPNGATFVAALRGKLRLVSSMTGNDLVAELPTGGNATHPDWALSGDWLAYTRYFDTIPPPSNDGDGEEIFVSRGAIGLSRYMGGAFQQGQIIIPQKTGQNSYYPSVAPVNDYLVFNRVSPCTVGRTNAYGFDDCTAYDNPKAQILLSTLGGTEIALPNINKRGPTDSEADLTNSWPKFSPFRQPLKGGKTLLWVTFSSKRNYGLRVVNGGVRPVENQRPQLWMAAITIGGEPTGMDPSAPPFWIPRQDTATRNHIAQWTEQIVPILQ